MGFAVRSVHRACCNSIVVVLVLTFLLNTAIRFTTIRDTMTGIFCAFDVGGGVLEANLG